MRFFLRNYKSTHGIVQAHRDLVSGAHRHDILEMVLKTMEDDTAINTVGRGGYPNILGEMELDAAFMDGSSRMLGAIARAGRSASQCARRDAGRGFVDVGDFDASGIEALHQADV